MPEVDLSELAALNPIERAAIDGLAARLGAPVLAYRPGMAGHPGGPCTYFSAVELTADQLEDLRALERALQVTLVAYVDVSAGASRERPDPRGARGSSRTPAVGRTARTR